MLRYLSLIVVMFLAMVPCRAADGIFIEHIAPPVVEVGKTTRITLSGNHLEDVLGLWTSFPNSTISVKVIESSSERAVLDLQVSAKTPVGMGGVRLATKHGLSNAHLFLIDDLPVRTELPKAESVSNTLPIKLPATHWNYFRAAEVDRYSFEVSAGQKVSFEAVASRFGKDADPLLIIRDATGKIVAERDNDLGLVFDTRFEHTFSKAGTYTVEIREARFRGSKHHVYAFRMGQFPAARITIPSAVSNGTNELTLPEIGNAKVSVTGSHGLSETPSTLALRRPTDQGSSWVPVISTELPIASAREFDPTYFQNSLATASPAMTLAFNFSPLRVNPFATLDAFLPTGRNQPTRTTVPGVLCGTLTHPGQRQYWVFELAKGESIFVKGEARTINSPVDLEISLVDRMGREQRRGNVRQNDPAEESILDFTANNPGLYGLSVRDQLQDGSPAHSYRLTVSKTPFAPIIQAEVEGLAIPQGTYQPIPLLITRPQDAGTPIKLKLLGASSGLKLVPDEIGEKDTAVVCQLHAEASVPLGLQTIQIVAETELRGAKVQTLVRTVPLIDKQIYNVDLIPHAFRDDQKRLPPELHNRLAVLITPPSPYTFEINEKTIDLARYQKSPIPILTTREKGFAAPISFTARGGQIANKTEGRTRVYAEFPQATAMQPQVEGVVVSKILANLGKFRIETTATTTHENRRISLTRTFQLNVTTAFTVVLEPAKAMIAPGESVKAKLVATRLPTFDGPIEIRMPSMFGFKMPEVLKIPKGQTSVEFTVESSPELTPNRYNGSIQAHAEVDGFEEEVRVGNLEIEIRKPEPPKKK